jgi:hypothetical protein
LAGIIRAPSLLAPSMRFPEASKPLPCSARLAEHLACQRQAVIAANHELRERKLAHYATAITIALSDRSVSMQQAKPRCRSRHDVSALATAAVDADRGCRRDHARFRCRPATLVASG